MALVDAHGAANSLQMLPLFESYLEKQAVESEVVYDRVRQGAVVFMGTLARHMEPGSPKVGLPFMLLHGDCFLAAVLCTYAFSPEEMLP